MTKDTNLESRLQVLSRRAGKLCLVSPHELQGWHNLQAAWDMSRAKASLHVLPLLLWDTALSGLYSQPECTVACVYVSRLTLDCLKLGVC